MTGINQNCEKRDIQNGFIAAFETLLLPGLHFFFNPGTQTPVTTFYRLHILEYKKKKRKTTTIP